VARALGFGLERLPSFGLEQLARLAVWLARRPIRLMRLQTGQKAQQNWFES
jgi:hypothetical protein